jgi:hypothetical protein
MRLWTQCPDTHCDYPPYSYKCVVHWDPQYAWHFMALGDTGKLREGKDCAVRAALTQKDA